MTIDERLVPEKGAFAGEGEILGVKSQWGGYPLRARLRTLVSVTRDHRPL
jgi:hypothetical protein